MSTAHTYQNLAMPQTAHFGQVLTSTVWVLPFCKGVIANAAGALPNCKGVTANAAGALPNCKGVTANAAGALPTCKGVTANAVVLNMPQLSENSSETTPTEGLIINIKN